MNIWIIPQYIKCLCDGIFVKKNKKSFETGPLSDAYLSTVMASMVRTEVWETASSMKGTRWHMALPISHMSWIRERETIKKMP
jgi:hypothetical protein